MTVINPFDFFVEEYAERYPFAYPAGVRADLEPYLRAVDEHHCVTAVPGSGPGRWSRSGSRTRRRCPTGAARSSTSSSTSTAARRGRRVHDPAGAGRPDAGRRRCELGARLLPRQRVAARERAARARARGPVRLRATSSSSRRTSSRTRTTRSTARPAPRRTSPTSTRGPRCTSPAPAGSASTRRPACFAGEGHIPLSATPAARRRPPRSPAPPSRARSRFDFANTVRRVHEDVRVTCAVHRRPSGSGSTRSAGTSTDCSPRATSGSPMGGEPTFVAIDDMESPQWNSDADGDGQAPARGRPRTPAARPVGARRPRPPRPGQVVSRVSRCRAGRSRSAGEPTASRCGGDAALLDDPSGPPVVPPGPPRPPGPSAGSPWRVAARLGHRRRSSWCPGVRGPRSHALSSEARPARGRAARRATPTPTDPALARPRSGAPRSSTPSTPTAGVPRGWVVPVFRDPGAATAGRRARWRTAASAPVPRPRVDSPLGLRLPLDAVAWTPPAAGRSPPDPFADTAAAARTPGTVRRRSGTWRLDVEPAAHRSTSRTRPDRARRRGPRRPPVRLPPAGRRPRRRRRRSSSRVEAAAASVGVPVVLEGYPPPARPAPDAR